MYYKIKKFLSFNYESSLLAAGCSDYIVRIYDVKNDFKLERELNDSTNIVI